MLSCTDKDGVSFREHLEQIEKQTGSRPSDLEPPVNFPDLIGYLWSAFISLNETRTVGMSGPDPIQYNEIKAWMELMGIHLDPWEIEVIKRLDSAYLEGIQSGKD